MSTSATRIRASAVARPRVVPRLPDAAALARRRHDRRGNSLDELHCLGHCSFLRDARVHPAAAGAAGPVLGARTHQGRTASPDRSGAGLDRFRAGTALLRSGRLSGCTRSPDPLGPGPTFSISSTRCATSRLRSRSSASGCCCWLPQPSWRRSRCGAQTSCLAPAPSSSPPEWPCSFRSSSPLPRSGSPHGIVLAAGSLILAVALWASAGRPRAAGTSPADRSSGRSRRAPAPAAARAAAAPGRGSSPRSHAGRL